MTKGRLEAFSDGVIAIIITIMVLELRAPHGDNLTDLLPLLSHFISYVLSFAFIGIYWSNHHHLIQATQKINGAALWANLHLLFWLSLTPFVTAWMGENSFTAAPVALYGMVLFFAAIAYYILVRALISLHGHKSPLARAIGGDFKGKVSIAIYLGAIPLSFVNSWVAYAAYWLVAVMWLVPDRRIEKVLSS